MIHVFLGTKAQYIKTAPLLRRMDADGVPYRLIDSGQHGALSIGLREELGVRDPDHVLGDGRDVNTIPQALAWSARLATNLFDGPKLKREVFGGHGGICVVHGDTPSTMLSTLMARRAGLEVAHLEAGLRSHKILDPFPEEAIRLVVMRLAAVLFAPDDVAVQNLRRMKVRGEVVRVEANTVVEAAAHAIGVGAGDGAAPTGPAIVTMHRVENLKVADRTRGLVDLVCETAKSQPVRFVTHGPTQEVFRREGHIDRLVAAGVEMLPLQPHGAFVRMLADAPWVITDGGSIQEECALVGVPTLLWRQRSERPDGIGDNVVVSGHDVRVAAAFLADPAAHRRQRSVPDVTPSASILAVLRSRAGI